MINNVTISGSEISTKNAIRITKRSSPSVAEAVSKIQNQKQKNLKGGTHGCLEGSENQKTDIESGRNGARKRLL